MEKTTCETCAEMGRLYYNLYYRITVSVLGLDSYQTGYGLIITVMRTVMTLLCFIGGVGFITPEQL
jgi:hypothetical protein